MVNFQKTNLVDRSVDPSGPKINAAFFNVLQDALVEARTLAFASEKLATIYAPDASFTGNPPAVAPDPQKAGRLGVATDQPRVYRDTGAAWELRAGLRWADLSGVPALFPPAAHGHLSGDLPLATRAEAEAGALNTKLMTPQRAREAGSVGAFAAAANANQAGIGANIWAKIQLHVEEYDSNGWFVPHDAAAPATSSRFTPMKAGFYRLTMFAQSQGTTAALYGSIWKNGADHKRTIYAPPSGGNSGGDGSATVYLNGVGDYAEFYVFNGSTTAGTLLGASAGHVHVHGEYWNG